MLKMRHGLTSLLLLLVLMGPHAVHAEDASRSALFIIDGSGSMWGRFEAGEERRAKIDVVRDIVRPILSSNTKARIGLQSFGHRRRGDCSDIELIAPMAIERDTLVQALDKLNPRGKGPLADTLRQAAQALGPGRPASIVVINDGVDNCRQDACAAAADFAKATPGVPVHMISIGIEAAELPNVQCIAKATGGKFYDVRDPISLTAAIQDAATLALGAPETAAAPVSSGPQTPEQAATSAALPLASLRATLVLTDGKAPLSLPATWRLYKDGSDQPLRTINAPAIAENVEPGNYKLSVERDGMAASTTLTTTDQPTTLALSLKAARMSVKAAGQPASPLITIRQTTDGKASGATVALQRAATLDTVLTPATYIVSFLSGEMRQEKTVKLAEGDDTSVDFDQGSGTLALSATLHEGAAPLTGVTFSIQEDDPDSPGGRREVRRSRAPSPKFTLPAGTYYAGVQKGAAEIRQRIAVSAGDALDKTLVLPAAEVTISASVGANAVPTDAGLVFRITALDGEPREVARLAGPQFSGLLKAGRYRVAAMLENHGAGVVQDIVVEAGKPLTRVLRIEAGEIALKGLGSSGQDPFWEVRDASGKAVWHTSAAQPHVLLAPGRYSVRMDLRDKTTEAAFALGAGESKTVEVGSN